jgi:2-oxo-4-hydroxy-4-carboxy--5-ureidoimidazoline (OHCU) decarboxylase
MTGAAARKQRGNELAERAAELSSQGRELIRSIADLAGRIAQTEDEVARIHQQIGENGLSAISAQALQHAERARRFAEHERREQARWAARG